ncbi:MAG TPA: carboxymuconolactone decarboxylase family protein [Bradyrhizobium sp.]|jgi:4-carboxymuconolactone decarboxylase|uniref:carboxymuconolactone decarboxylase family protein n=1 Tax=Bradyrhizobium sp. TaxID=376 RepID=UPI002D0A3DAF|nr:carboxymuconolactone decarboxylase family protein [Bradyrhizobium sp.]HTB00224.1 carboxymuconolactone decarboxylase family protein [Bradyrhizobium sp.]
MKSLMSAAGAKTRREVLGDEWVDGNSQNATEFDRAWQMYVTNINWAGTWSRNIIPPQQLSLVNLAMLAASGQMHEFELHFRVALLRTRVPLEQLRELLLHIAQYCGIATGTSMFRIARRVLAEEAIDLSGIEPLDTNYLYSLSGDEAD